VIHQEFEFVRIAWELCPEDLRIPAFEAGLHPSEPGLVLSCLFQKRLFAPSTGNPQTPMSRMLSLIGYRGTGKSTVGMRLARRLKWDWIDTDNEVERRAGRTIKEIFATEGEPRFRQIERDVIVDLVQRNHLVVSTGGGAILNADSRRDLREAGPVVWLTAPVQTIASRILQDSTTAARRPNLTSQGGIAEIREVLTRREPLYRECATLVINTEGLKLTEVVAMVLEQLPAELLAEHQP
jgi:shikimate kinase